MKTESLDKLKNIMKEVEERNKIIHQRIENTQREIKHKSPSPQPHSAQQRFLSPDSSKGSFFP